MYEKFFLLLLMTIAILPAMAQIQGVDKAKMVAERFFSQQRDGMGQSYMIQDGAKTVKLIKAKSADGGANSIGQESAEIVETNSRQAVRRRASEPAELELVYDMKDADRSLLYIFSNKEQKEFAIITADEMAPTIIAYSTKQAFDKDNIIPPVKAFIDAYSRMLKDGKSIRKAAASTDRHSVWPLVETQWDQGAPYNMMVPDGNLVGCIPLVMGQMMKYYEYPKQGRGEHGGINFAEQHYDYSRMLCAHSSESNSAEVGKLLYHAGVACDAEYGPDATGAKVEIAVEAMKTYFSYDTSVTLAYRSNMDDAAWDEMVYAELAAGHPLIYSGFPENYEGHTFIVDGYHDDYYHVNWGWGGFFDGYFLLSELMDYQYRQSAVFGLAPDGWTPGQKETSQYKTFGYCDNTIASIENIAYDSREDIGHEKGISLGFPMSHLAPYAGATIIGVQIGLAEDVTGMRVFLNEGYQWCTPAQAGYSEPYYTQEVGNCYQGWNTIMFDTPQTVDRGFNVAYEYDMRPHNGAVAYSPNTYTSQLYIRDNLGAEFPSYDGGWSYYSYITYMPCIRLIFADDTEMPYDVRVPYMEEVTAVDNAHIKLKGVIENLSGCDITQVTMKYVIDTKPEKTITLNQPVDKNGKAYFSLIIEEELTPGDHKLRVWPVEVDGHPDASMHNSDVYKLSPLTFKIKGESSIPRTHVIDAAVDTYCPFSNWYMSLQEEYAASNPEQAIFINTHVQLMGPDPMDNALNHQFDMDWWGGTPTVFFNGLSKNPYNEIGYQLSTFDQTSPVAINGLASFSADKKKVIVKTDANFAYTHDAEYHYEYALVEENVGPLKELDGAVYNHVVRAKYTTNQEVFPYPVEAGKTYENYYSLDIPDNVQDVNNTHMVVIVVDDNSGEFMNGVDLQIGDYKTDVFTLDKPQLSMMTDLTAKLNVVDNSKTASDDLHVWTSSDEFVVRVMDDGFVQTTGSGTAVITCTSASSGATAQCQVNVEAWPNEVTVATPGTLHELVEVCQYTSLKVNGNLNEYDVEYIRALTGGEDQFNPANSSGTVSSLNLKDTRIHYQNENDWKYYYPVDNVLPAAFGGNLRHLVCPTSIKTLDGLGNGWLNFDFSLKNFLRSLTMYEGLENINEACTGNMLNHVYIPSTVNSLSGSFEISDIEHFGVAENSPFRVYDDCLYTKDGRLVKLFAKYKRKLVLPDWCTETEANHRLDERVIETVALCFTTITEDLSNRKSKKLVFGPMLKEANGLFSNARDLREVVMPPLTPPVLNALDCMMDPATCTLYVNPQSIELYKAHPEWSKFNIQPMTDEMLAEMEPYYQIETGITEIKTDKGASGNVYDIFGRRIQADMPRNTILIQDNKKFIAR